MAQNCEERICICCPAGCHLTITRQMDGNFVVSGNHCPRGKKYAISEMTDPRRIVTCVVPTTSQQTTVLPAKTDAPLPIALIPELLQTIYALRLKLPQKMGQILLSNFKDTGVNVVLTRGAEK